MPDGFRQIRLYRFRNLLDLTLTLDSSTVVLVGDNGQGKTNLLEALYLLSYGTSFRTRNDRELCTIGADEMLVAASYGSEALTREMEIRIISGRKTITLDGTPVTDRRDLISTVPTVLFQHDDMQFVTGGPEMHRLFLDQILSMVRVAYIDDLRRYRRTLRNRNAALKDERVDLVRIYDAQLAEVGLSLQRQRAAAIERFSEIFSDLYESVSHLGEPITVGYRASWRESDTVEQVVSALADRIDHDLRMKTTTSGPHRDRLGFSYRGRDFLDIASTGQTRLIVLILRVAQAAFVLAETASKPVLLLDDVMLELDPSRRERFLEVLPPSRQRIFTVLPGEGLTGYGDDDALVYSVSDGRFERTARR